MIGTKRKASLCVEYGCAGIGKTSQLLNAPKPVFKLANTRKVAVKSNRLEDK